MIIRGWIGVQRGSFANFFSFVSQHFFKRCGQSFTLLTYWDGDALKKRENLRKIPSVFPLGNLPFFTFTSQVGWGTSLGDSPSLQMFPPFESIEEDLLAFQKTATNCIYSPKCHTNTVTEWSEILFLMWCVDLYREAGVSSDCKSDPWGSYWPRPDW